MTNYLDRFQNAQKFNGARNGRLVSRGVQEHGMKILYTLHTNGFDLFLYNDKKEADTSGEEILCATLNLENSDKARFADLKKCVKNDYILNKSEYPRTVIALHSLILNYQTNYNYNSQSQYQGFRNQLIFTQNGKPGDNKGETKDY